MVTILVVDDDPSLRALLEATLESPETRVLVADSGVAALRIAAREVPDVMVLDWSMPGLTGIEVTTALRTQPATAGIPVIMLTAMGLDENRNAGISAGVAAYLVKPFSPLELLHKVQDVLSTNARRSRGEHRNNNGLSLIA
jgi:two-component system phosphate regulon response regulator PhoB